MPDPSDFIAAATAAGGRSGIPCRIGEVLRAEEADRPAIAEQMRTALARDDIQHTGLAKAFNQFGHPEVSDNMVMRHRNGGCRNCWERLRAAA